MCGIGLGIYARERRMKTPRIIPVRYHTYKKGVRQKGTPETLLAYHNPRRAKAIRKSSDEKHLITPAARRRRALELAADVTTGGTDRCVGLQKRLTLSPADYGYSYSVNWGIVREHPDVFLPILDELISAQSSMNELGLGGLIALTLQDSDSVERANKEIVRRLRQTPKKIGAPLYFLKVQKEDLQSIDGLAEVIAPYLQSTSYSCEADHFVQWLGAPESEMRKHLKDLQREFPPLPEGSTRVERNKHYSPLQFALKSLRNSPLVREEAAGEAFICLVGFWGPGGHRPESDMFKKGDLPWKERALAELCKYGLVCTPGSWILRGSRLHGNRLGQA